MTNITDKYKEFVALSEKIADVRHSFAVLQWDQEVFMPSHSSQRRGNQLGTLAQINHELSTHKKYVDIINELYILRDELSFVEKRNIEETHRQLQKDLTLDAQFVHHFNLATSNGFNKWLQAKEAGDYSIFQGSLTELVNLSKEKAERYTYKNHIYNALLDEYEPYCTVDELDTLFISMKEHLTPIINTIIAQEKKSNDIFENNYEKDNQIKLCKWVAEKLGFDFTTGRLDFSEHPFTTKFSSKDVRITTKVNENDFCDAMWSTIHEVGHGLYEQGLPDSDYGLPSSEYISLAIHESQSRFWENNIGKSALFVKGLWNKFSEVFPIQSKGYTSDDFYTSLNTVTPNLIRINSDELTYHYHILLRYELEKMLIEGSLDTKDLEEAWNEKIKLYLGLEVPSAKVGVLQDVHWSHGSFGYFATYSLGSFYAAQFESTMRHQIVNFDQSVENLDFKKILNWKRTQIHQFGRQYTAKELCKKITGESLNYQYFGKYVANKYRNLYEL